MPLQATSGAASYDAFGGGVPVVPNYIEDVFSTYLYQADGSSTQTINNGIDLSGKGGLVWIKSRSNATGNVLVDTVRGSPNVIQSNTTNAQASWTNEFGSFSSTGFTVPYNTIYGETNFQTRTYVSWTFREQPKFFDVLTYSGTGSAQTIAHNLGSTPGCIMIKQTSGAGGTWWVWHTSINTSVTRLNTTDASLGWGTLFNGVQPSSTSFDVGANANSNANGQTFVAYLFAHNAGGFGLTGTDNVISCGSFTTDGSGAYSVSLGYEPQWVMIKRSDGTGSWFIQDVMRGMTVGNGPVLLPNTSGAEGTPNDRICPNATGFYSNNTGGTIDSSANYIYIAIRRGPMKVPTSGTSVLNITTSAGTSPAYVSSFPVDFAYRKQITTTSSNYFHTRLQGAKTLYTNSTAAEDDDSNVTWAYQNGMFTTTGANADQYGWLMRRAPSFFDEVCGTSTGTFGSFKHNLGVAPELVIFKDRNATGNWRVLATSLSKWCVLNGTIEFRTTNIEYYFGNDTTYIAPTATDVFFGSSAFGNFTSGITYVAYLFATCAGVSKVGTYTGNGSTQTIDCGFTGGARFVLIKRTDSTGDWYVYDTARGMTVLTDPYLRLNSTGAEVATLGSVTTVSTGFALNATILAAINTNAASYIFLAIA